LYRKYTLFFENVRRRIHVLGHWLLQICGECASGVLDVVTD
jgi:hypothetical protein